MGRFYAFDDRVELAHGGAGMSLMRQGGQYVAFGLVQLGVDWAVFVATTALGLPPALGNLAGRGSGALLGYWLNGRYTFAGDGRTRLGWKSFARFWALWLLMTLLSTWLLDLIARQLGLPLAWLAKPLVEAMLAAANFVLLRQLVYR